MSDRIQVRVLEVDLDRRRIALSASRGVGQTPEHAPASTVTAADR